MAEDHAPYLRPTFFIDSESPTVTSYVREVIGDAGDITEKAKRLFLAVRDGVRYDPHGIEFDPEIFKASVTLERKTSFCVPKAVLLTACFRAAGIPSRLGFADVSNHLSTERLTQLMGTNVFVFHGYSQVFLNGKWLKATPTFNATLCKKFGVEPLEFDGIHDAVFQQFTPGGDRHMEYLKDRGHYADLPLEELHRVWTETYPQLFNPKAGL